MTDKLEDLFRNAVQGKPYSSGESNSNKDIKMDKPMTLKHSQDDVLGESMICNEDVDINNVNNDQNNEEEWDIFIWKNRYNPHKMYHYKRQKKYLE